MCSPSAPSGAMMPESVIRGQAKIEERADGLRGARNQTHSRPSSKWRGRAAAQHDVEAVAHGPFGLCERQIERRHQALPRILIGDRMQDRIDCHQRIAGKIHLGHQAAQQARSEEREMNVGRSPGIRMIAPWIRSGLDGDKAVIAGVVRDRAAGSQKIWIERRRMAVPRMAIATGCIRLPHFHQRVRNTAAVFVDDTSGDDDALAQRRVREMPCEVVVAFADRIVAVERARQLTERMRHLNQRLGGRAPYGGPVAFVQILGLRAGLGFWDTPSFAQ